MSSSASATTKPTGTNTNTPVSVLLQHATGMFLAPYVGLHLLNHSLTLIPSDTPFSVANGFTVAVRELYQHPIIEPIGAAAIAVHVAAGMYRFAAVRGLRVGFSRNTPGYWTRASGLFLASVIVGHVYFTRIAALMTWGDSTLMDYTYGTWTVKFYGPVFMVYYVALGSAGAVHLINGWLTIKEKAVANKSLMRLSSTAKFVNYASIAIITASVLAISGYFFDVDILSMRQFERLKSVSTFGMF
ncbi:hypothetical protein BC828DRAFT_372840 [Blastocladiella britannica]|nr:hypothetical protein BC828DRAFT_372840 [Blastocladiella britannica]